jgi:hypothetical protein
VILSVVCTTIDFLAAVIGDFSCIHMRGSYAGIPAGLAFVINMFVHT